MGLCQSPWFNSGFHFTYVIFQCCCPFSFGFNTLFHFSVNLPPYYLPYKEIEDFICSKDTDSGMRQCANLPRYQFEGIKCNGSAKPYVNNTPTNSSCVNWNQYYTVCDAGDKNPFQGAISFDNIGLAWVAIFQVSGC